MGGPIATVSVHFGAGTIAAAAAGACVGTAAQAVCGFGFSLVIAPILVQLIGAPRAVRLANLLAVSVNVLVLLRDRRAARPDLALRLLIPAVAVSPVVAYGVHRTSPRVLSVIAGATILVSAGALASGRRWNALRGTGGTLAAGGISAAMNTTSGVGGPTVAMYALNAEWPVGTTRATLQLYFLGLNAISLVSLGGITLPAGDLVGLLAAVACGFLAGTALARRLSPITVGRAVLVMSLCGGLAAVARAIAS